MFRFLGEGAGQRVLDHDSSSAPSPIEEPTSRFWVVAACAAGLLSAVLMILHLDATGLNGDEGFTAQMVKLPWSSMLSDLGRIDYNMSLHYVVLKAWTSVFGTSEAALRLPSVIFALAALPVLYRLVARLFNERLAALSVILLALNPFFLKVGLGGRPFAFLILWSVAATFILTKAIEIQSRRWWLWYGLIAVVGLHIHLTAALIIAAHGIFAIAYQRRINRFNLEAIAVIALVGFVPTLVYMAPPDTLAWIGPFSFLKALRVGRDVAGGGGIGWTVIAIAAFGLLRPPRGSTRMRWLPSVWLGIPVLLCLAMAPLQSLFVEPYFAGVLAPLAVVTGFGLDRILTGARRWVVHAALVVSGAALLISVAGDGLNHGHSFRELVSMMDGRVQDGDAVAFPNAYYRIVNEYYSIDEAAGPYPPAQPTLPAAPWTTLSAYELDFLKRTGVQADHAVFEPEALQWDRIWIVGLGDEFDRAVIDDLVFHGYQEADVVESDAVSARLYALTAPGSDHAETP